MHLLKVKLLISEPWTHLREIKHSFKFYRMLGSAAWSRNSHCCFLFVFCTSNTTLDRQFHFDYSKNHKEVIIHSWGTLGLHTALFFIILFVYTSKVVSLPSLPSTTPLTPSLFLLPLKGYDKNPSLRRNKFWRNKISEDGKIPRLL